MKPICLAARELGWIPTLFIDSGCESMTREARESRWDESRAQSRRRGTNDETMQCAKGNPVCTFVEFPPKFRYAFLNKEIWTNSLFSGKNGSRELTSG